MAAPDEIQMGRECHTCGEVKPLTDFYAKASGKNGKQPNCKACDVTRVSVNWNLRSPEQKRRHHLAKHGITLEIFDKMFDEQGRKCAICGSASSGARQWHVDHDHSCCPGTHGCPKCFRGVLCHLCNSGLGSFRDNPAHLSAARDYLERTAA